MLRQKTKLVANLRQQRKLNKPQEHRGKKKMEENEQENDTSTVKC